MPPKKFLIDDDDDEVLSALLTKEPTRENCAAVAAAPSPVPPMAALGNTPKRSREDAGTATELAVSNPSSGTVVTTRGGDGMAKISLLAFGMAKCSLVNNGGASQHTPKAQKLQRVESTPTSAPKLLPVAKPLTFAPAAPIERAALPSPVAAAELKDAASPAAASGKSGGEPLSPAPAAEACSAPVAPKKTQTSLLSFFSKMAHQPKAAAN
jgi:hypothetical protein